MLLKRRKNFKVMVSQSYLFKEYTTKGVTKEHLRRIITLVLSLYNYWNKEKWVRYCICKVEPIIRLQIYMLFILFVCVFSKCLLDLFVSTHFMSDFKNKPS